MEAVILSSVAFIPSIIFSLGFILVIFFLLETRRSKKYRRELGDFYVAAKIREIANNEELDLNLEYERFKAWIKRRRLEDKRFDFDEVVEEELKEKVEDKLNKAMEKMEEKEKNQKE